MLAVSGGIAVGALVGPGLANAYPPKPPPPGNTLDVGPVPPAPGAPEPPPPGNTLDVGPVVPAGTAPGIVQQVPGVDTLPRTGNSDVAQTLMIAAATLVTGLGITVVSRRRASATVDTAVKPA